MSETQSRSHCAREEMVAAIEADHQTLAALIERVAGICEKDGGCHCGDCSPEKTLVCEDVFALLAEKMLMLMIEHFEREELQMSRLPQTAAMLHHCVGHRKAHSELTHLYNRAVGRRQHGSLADNIRDFQSFLIGWSRNHALHYDVELARLLQFA